MSARQDGAARVAALASLSILLSCSGLLLWAAHRPAVVQAAASAMLPNGWRVTPQGMLTPLGTLPLHAVVSPDGVWLAITNAGYGQQSVTVVKAADGTVSQRLQLPRTFYGLVWSPDERFLYVSTAAGGSIARYSFEAAHGRLTPAGDWPLVGKKLWVTGLAVSADGKTVYAAVSAQPGSDLSSDYLQALDVSTGSASLLAPIGTGAQPYDVLLSSDGSKAYLSNWAGSSVSVVPLAGGGMPAAVAVAAHPTALELSHDGRTLYVACSNADEIDAIDTGTAKVVKRIQAGLTPLSREGAAPSGLALTLDDRTLFVADADTNAVVAIDVKHSPARTMGAIPTGWYPTDVALSPDGTALFILDGKGVSGRSNPGYGHPDKFGPKSEQASQYIGELLTGDLERLALPDRLTLGRGLRQARDNMPHAAASRPSKLGSYGISHVIFVIKENRTYDEVLGDDKRGNGDARLAVFGRAVTPNIHALARDFILLDNFDVDAEVSADGHNWSTAAYATDYVQKLWPSSYSGRGRPYDFEKQGPASPASGYLWDDANAHRVSVRSYGEFVVFDTPPGKPRQPAAYGLAGRVAPKFAGFNLNVSDQSRVDAWLDEFRSYERGGNMPQLQIVRLPNDHTGALKPGLHTPDAFVADNDYALGRMVAALSHSRYWRSTAMFVVEDDAQAGPDHVSAQRAEALVIGPFVRRGVVDHTHYTTSGMIRTIEEILDLPPMSEFDRLATPMDAVFRPRPDLRAFDVLKPRVDLTALNPPSGPGAQASQALDLRAADRVDDALMNALLMNYARTRSRL